ncbi:PIN domain-containing protein [Parapedobacter indicus]|uniref:PIN domain-containing protein n=1 Tax=Parapedobacter indicus TaxID=1477437 RepID=A0A1I3KA17_9SPHI|nr:PIN domain-containing protein [Parapedobacter indicus]PPL01751.1 PIN domain-containing protein [Parapedobacter indicus]SFI69055.1 PIN domain-containing protein [Parapedobacter indicus]
MNKVLIDTDVILDFFFDREPFSVDTSKILSLCEKGELRGFVTPIMISNVYYLLRKTAKHEKVIEHLKMLMNILQVSMINKETVLDALNSDFKDFEDALQNFSAQNEKEINVIITRNIKDYKSSKLSVMTPETYLKSR